jgi:hypothetical protein
MTPSEAPQWLNFSHRLELIAQRDVVLPTMPEDCHLGRNALMIGYAGVYSSFLRHADNAAERYGVSAADPARGR